MLAALPLLATAAFAFADPAGDAHGNGQYILPTTPPTSADALDLRDFRAEKRDGRMHFEVSFGGTANPWQLASGFSAGVTDIFVKTGLGGQTQLDDLNLHTAAGGWQYHLRITGGKSTLEKAGETAQAVTLLSPPEVSMAGTTLNIEAAIPPGEYSYWVTSSVYSPLSTAGVMLPGTQSSPTGLQAPASTLPAAVDVLAAENDQTAYSTGSLAAVGKTRDLRPWGLGLLALLGLGSLLWGSIRLRRLASDQRRFEQAEYRQTLGAHLQPASSQSNSFSEQGRQNP